MSLSSRPQNKNFGDRVKNLGSIARTEKKNERMALYESDPNYCLICKIKLPYRGPKKFCSTSHASQYNNKIRPKESREKQRNSLLKSLGLDISQVNLYQAYYRSCSFSFKNEDYSRVIGGHLLAEYSMYHPINNPNGVSRDHMFSVLDGFLNRVDSAILKHPANCEIMTQTKNASKGSKSSITLEELMTRIKNWG